MPVLAGRFFGDGRFDDWFPHVAWGLSYYSIRPPLWPLLIDHWVPVHLCLKSIVIPRLVQPVAQEADGFDWIAIPDRISIHTRMVKDVYYRTRELRQPADANEVQDSIHEVSSALQTLTNRSGYSPATWKCSTTVVSMSFRIPKMLPGSELKNRVKLPEKSLC